MLIFTSCSDNTDVALQNSDDSTTENVSADESQTASENPIATITLEDGRTITIELYYDKAPNTVKNFIYLANEGFYDGLTFHRVISGFMIQGGDPNNDCTGGPGYAIKGEFTNNGDDNDLKNKSGYVAMARGGYSMDSAGSQFFINVNNNTSLDGDYAVFGYVIDGMDIVYEISNVATDSNDNPLEDVIFKSITIDTKGVAYEEPETIAE